MTVTPQPGGYRRRWIGLFAVLAAALMNLLDANIMNVAAPKIRTDLGGSYADLQWLTAAYTLAMAVGLLTGGRLGDIFGRKRMLLLGAAGFTLASIGCALAPSEGALIAVRAIQGLVGAVMVPQGFGLIRDMFPPRDVGKAFGVFGPSIGLATILGPIVAGLLIQLDGWRLIFVINVPLGMFAIAVGAKVLPDVTPTAQRTRLDLTGTLLAGAAMFLLVFPLVQGRQLIGLAGVYLVLTHTHTALSGWILAGPLLAFGIGMGMIFLPLYDIIMADIADREVGSAAGVLEAVQQLGASLGVAVLGTIFFGAIGAGALHTIDTSTAPRLRTELSAADVPAGAQQEILARFRACVYGRENATDPSTAPASCRAGAGPAAPAVTQALAAAAVQTHRQDSLRAAEITALASIALAALAFGIGFLLPARARAQTYPASDTEHATAEPVRA
jgi:MFS family permease